MDGSRGIPGGAPRPQARPADSPPPPNIFAMIAVGLAVLSESCVQLLAVELNGFCTVQFFCCCTGMYIYRSMLLGLLKLASSIKLCRCTDFGSYVSCRYKYGHTASDSRRTCRSLLAWWCSLEHHFRAWSVLIRYSRVASFFEFLCACYVHFSCTSQDVR